MAKPFNFWKYMTYVLTIGIFVTIAILVFAVDDGNACLANPFLYGADKISDEQTKGVSCTCNFQNPNYASFVFNKDNISVTPVLGAPIHNVANFSLNLKR